MEDTETSTNSQPGRSAAIAAVVILLLIAAAIFISGQIEHIRLFIAGSGIVGILTAIILYGVLGASPIPSEPLTILLASIFGPLTATLTAGAGNLFAALIEYYLGAKIGDAASFHRQREKLPFGLGKLPVHSPVFLMGGRMVPGYGSKLVSILGGLYRVPVWRYLWTTAIPTFTGAAIFAYGGFGLLRLAGH